MGHTLVSSSIRETIKSYFVEDDLNRNIYYLKALPNDLVECHLKIKDDMILAGLPYFVEVFNYLSSGILSYKSFNQYEGAKFLKNEKLELDFSLPFSIALTGERIALNLLQHASSIATLTNQFVEKAAKKNISILDTRKTLPGHRSLEKYAVCVGGGFNHRFGQADMWMVKDNHKNFFGGIENAINFFKNIKGFYTPIEVEVHSEEEFHQVIKLGVNHIMLDNFSPESIRKLVSKKPQGVTIEISGGVRLHNLEEYLIEGIDAISVGALTNGAPTVDISLKYFRK